MTSRSRKKRPTTARTFTPATPARRWALAGLAACTTLAGLAAKPLIAQSPYFAPPPSGQLRPVEKARTATLVGGGTVRGSAMPVGYASATAPLSDSVAQFSLRQHGWQLQWRKSPTVAQDDARQVSDQAYRPAGGVDVPSVAASGTTRSPVQPATFVNQAGSDSGFALPGLNLPAVPAAPSQSAPPAMSLPAPQAADASPLANPFRDSTIDPPPMRNPAADPAPLDAPSAAGDGSSIRDLLQEPSPAEPPDVELPEPGPATTTPRKLPPSDERSKSETVPSPSDREFFDSNPFGRSTTPDAENERGDKPDRENRPSLLGDDERPEGSGTGLSCDEFRRRIAIDTIDRVSLDISPPFRPDIIDEADYQELKSEFEQDQEERVWRSIDGKPLGTGRLEDLAYEKAVIVTRFGTREQLPINQLSEPDLIYIAQNWGLPTECLIEQVAFTPRQWTPSTMVWAASNLCHKPLYFEEVNLERYGHTAGPLAQPFVSSAHFFLNIAVLPYKMGVHSPHECQYALGYYRPGNCAPWIIPPVPLSVKGAWYQAAAISGTALLVP